ncbi:MAG: nucleotidyltransferase family protein [Desulfobacteraceae bacterium]|nr:nucleotidyltransferase family protein [Desulfobacteraceae bacterium]
MTKARIHVPKERIAEFCRKNRIQSLSLFGSALRDDFGADSDVDVLVEFKPGARIGLIQFTRLELELSDIFGRKVDLNTPGFLNKHFRDKILAEKEVQHVEA